MQDSSSTSPSTSERRRQAVLSFLANENNIQVLNLYIAFFENQFFSESSLGYRQLENVYLIKAKIASLASSQLQTYTDAKEFMHEVKSQIADLYMEDSWLDWCRDDDLATMWFWQELRLSRSDYPRPLTHSEYAIHQSKLSFFAATVHQYSEIEYCPGTHQQRLDQIKIMLSQITFFNNKGPVKFAKIEYFRSLWGGKVKYSIKPKLWERNGPPEAAFWAFEALLDSNASRFNFKGTVHPYNRFDKLKEDPLIRDLNIHLNPATDREALLAYYALAWRLMADNKEVTEEILDKCADFCNQKVRRFQEAETRRATKAETRKHPRLQKTNIEADTESHANYAYSVMDAGSVFAVRLGVANSALDQALANAQAEAGFFVVKDPRNFSTLDSNSVSALQSEFEAAVHAQQGTVLNGIRYDLAGSTPPSIAHFVVGLKLANAKALAKQLRQSEIVWCRRGKAPVLKRV